MGAAAGSLLALLFVALICAAPLVAATFVAARMGHRGLTLIAPWAAAIGLGLSLGISYTLLAGRGGERESRIVITAWTIAMLLPGYAVTLGYLIFLAARRLPVTPAGAEDVF